MVVVGKPDHFGQKQMGCDETNKAAAPASSVAWASLNADGGALNAAASASSARRLTPPSKSQPKDV